MPAAKGKKAGRTTATAASRKKLVKGGAVPKKSLASQKATPRGKKPSSAVHRGQKAPARKAAKASASRKTSAGKRAAAKGKPAQGKSLPTRALKAAKPASRTASKKGVKRSPAEKHAKKALKKPTPKKAASKKAAPKKPLPKAAARKPAKPAASPKPAAKKDAIPKVQAKDSAPVEAAGKPAARKAAATPPRTKRSRMKFDSPGEITAAWFPQPESALRPASFIPAPPRAEAPSNVAAPPAMADREVRRSDMSNVEEAIRTHPIRIDIEYSAGRTLVQLSPEELEIRAGDGIEWDFWYYGGADLMVDEVVIEFPKPSPFGKSSFKAKKPNSPRHRELSGPAHLSNGEQRYEYTIRCINSFKTEVASARPRLVIVTARLEANGGR
jgi:hypothetical protein